jgi:hypothetical protein
MQFCEVMAMSLVYNPWVIEDGDAEEAAAENNGRTHMAHPHDKEACRFRRKCVGCQTATHSICSGCSNPGQSSTCTIVRCQEVQDITWI